jgi:YesN/AraC family two-component response regulator
MVAKNAKLALHHLSNLDLAQQVGLVITDHLMPGMNGPEFVAELRSRFPTLPVFVLSGYPDAEVEYQGSNVLYRLKPIAPQELLRIVESIAGNQLTRIA